MYHCFNLVLMATSFCNLRCDYCYVGKKNQRRITEKQASRAIDRALASMITGGDLELGFFRRRAATGSRNGRRADRLC